MTPLIHQIFAFFIHLGGFGLLLLAVLDSSFFFFLPLGHDVLIVALTARRPDLWWFFALMATAGSLIGTASTDWAGRKGGEEGLEKHLPKKRLDYVKKKVEKNAVWALVLASIMPPPFPFTGFIVAAAALKYPRKKLLLVVGVSRFVRFVATALLAAAFGRQILKIADSPIVHYAILGLIVISIVGTIVSVVTWAKKSRKVQRASEA